MFKKTHPICVATFFWVFTAQGMEKESSVPLKNYVFNGSGIYLSLSSSSEDEIDEYIDQFHMVKKEDCDTVKVVVAEAKKSTVILEDYQNASDIKKVSDTQEDMCDPIAYDWSSWINEKCLNVENYLSSLKDIKDKAFIPRDTQQRH